MPRMGRPWPAFPRLIVNSPLVFCPLCKAEYRQGITICPDCNVALVPQLPEGEEHPEGLLVPLWAGEDPALHDRLLESLDEAGIRFLDQPTGLDPRARRDDPLFIGRRPHFGFEIMVFSSQLAAARKVLETLLDEEPEDASLPVGNEPESEPHLPAPNIEEKPTCEIWTGHEQGVADFIEAALRENEIPFHIENTGQAEVVYVRPRDEPRAREILREITQASPPE